MDRYSFLEQEEQYEEELDYYETRQERRQRKSKKVFDQMPNKEREFVKKSKSGNDRRWREKAKQY
jgi:hypothetical protein